MSDKLSMSITYKIPVKPLFYYENIDNKYKMLPGGKVEKSSKYIMSPACIKNIDDKYYYIYVSSESMPKQILTIHRYKIKDYIFNYDYTPINPVLDNIEPYEITIDEKKLVTVVNCKFFTAPTILNGGFLSFILLL